MLKSCRLWQLVDVAHCCRVAPKEECSRNPFTLFALTYDGSHCSHLSGLWPFGQSWLDQVVGEWFTAILALADTADTAKEATESESEEPSRSEDRATETASMSSESTALTVSEATAATAVSQAAAGAQPAAGTAGPPPGPALQRQHSTAGLR